LTIDGSICFQYITAPPETLISCPVIIAASLKKSWLSISSIDPNKILFIK
jgi:hypothetical protein